MPVEIREMVVKAMVPSSRKEGEQKGEPDHEGGESCTCTEEQQAAIIEKTVTAVMRILEKKGWR